MSFVDHDKFEKACKVGDLETVKKLFDKFVNNDYILKMRNLAVKKGNLNVLEYFYRRGVDINVFNYHIHNCDNENPIMIAAEKGWVDTESRPRWRGLDDAKFNHARVIKFSVDFLIKIGVDINLQNINGGTALMTASMTGNIDVIDSLLKTEKCNVNLKTELGCTALEYAVINGHLGIVDRLLAYGANYYYYCTDYNGDNLLHSAAQSGDVYILQRILSLGLDVNEQNDEGWTPLMYAVEYENKEMVKFLMEHGADLKIKNNKGYNASDLTKDTEIKDLFCHK